MSETILHPDGCACCGDMLRARFDRRRFLHVAAGAGIIAAFPSLVLGAEGNYDAMLLLLHEHLACELHYSSGHSAKAAGAECRSRVEDGLHNAANAGPF